MPKFVEGQAARLDVGESQHAGVNESLACRVIGFSGHDVVLALKTQPKDDLAAGVLAYLLVESDGRLQAMRGRLAAPHGDEVVLRLTDDIRLGQRRVFSRAPLELHARVRSGDGGLDWSTVTYDVSAGGVCVVRTEAADPGNEVLQLTIQVADHEVVAETRAVRVTATEVGLRFEQIERDDRLLLAALALAYHRRS